MKKLVLGMAVAGLVVMAGEGSAKALTTCEMEQAILEAQAAIDDAGGENSTLTDAKGVAISKHVAYLKQRMAWAQEAVDSGYATYPDELYATVTEGARALRLITGQAQETATPVVEKSAAAPVAQAAKTVAQALEPMTEAKAPEVTTSALAEKADVAKSTGVKLAVAKIESVKAVGGVELANVSVQTTVAAPEEMAGLDAEMKVPATGEVETWEMEKLLMTIGVASAVGMLVLAGICAVIGRR